MYFLYLTQEQPVNYLGCPKPKQGNRGHRALSYFKALAPSVSKAKLIFVPAACHVSVGEKCCRLRCKTPHTRVMPAPNPAARFLRSAQLRHVSTANLVDFERLRSLLFLAGSRTSYEVPTPRGMCGVCGTGQPVYFERTASTNDGI